MSPIKDIVPVSPEEARNISWRRRPKVRRLSEREPDEWDIYADQVESILDNPAGSGVAQVVYVPYEGTRTSRRSDIEAYRGSTRLRTRLLGRGRFVNMKTERMEDGTAVVFIRNSID